MREDALSSLIRGESANPFDPQIPYARATILMRVGRLEDAKRAAQRALEIQPDYDAARQLLKNVGGF
jgi:Flp pilus assembly protein TadD